LIYSIQKQRTTVALGVREDPQVDQIKCCGSDEGKGERKRLWSVIKRQRNGPKIIRQYAAYNTREKKGGNIVTNSVDSSVFLKIRAT
jgi:hypothetical protein